VRADDKKAPDVPDLQEEMRNALPGPVHEQLAKRVGEYTTTVKFHIKPDAPPIETAGTAKITTALDGRFLVEENKGKMFGQPNNGMRLMGYNNASKQYEGTWTYSMSTAIMTLSGTSKDDGKTIHWNATFTDGRGKQNLQVLSRYLDDDHFVVELTAKNPDGSPGPTMEMAYTRKK
jgi:hypothetical protein